MTSRWLKRIILAATLSAACGTSAPQLTRTERDRLPRDGRQEIFDSENDLVIARNRQDEAVARRQALSDAIDDLRDRRNRMENRLEKVPGGSNRVSLARQVLKAEKEYLEAQMDVADAQIEVCEKEVVVAKARLTLVKQRQLARIGRVPITSLPDFEKDIATKEEKAKNARSSDMDLRVKAQTKLDTWKAAQQDYARQTGDFDTAVWLD